MVEGRADLLYGILADSFTAQHITGYVSRKAEWIGQVRSGGGIVRQGFYGTDRLGFAVTRADIAAFTAAQVDDARYVGAAPAISN
jgi:hypothetical protein